MKKIVGIFLSMLVFVCNSNILFCGGSSGRNEDETLTKMVLKSLAIGGAVATGSSALTKFKLPSSLIFVLGYYGSLVSFGVLSYKDLKRQGAGALNVYGFIVLPALLTLSFLGLIPLAVLAGLGKTR